MAKLKELDFIKFFFCIFQFYLTKFSSILNFVWIFLLFLAFFQYFFQFFFDFLFFWFLKKAGNITTT